MQPDIRQCAPDPSLPPQERLRRFAALAGDPYRFRVGDIAVQVRFAPDAPSLQACLQRLCQRAE